MKVLCYLYKVMYDAVKDAEMITGYVLELQKEENMEDMMKYFAANAVNRLTKDYKDAKALFETIVAKENISVEDHMGCVATMALEELDSWKDNVIHRLEKI